MHALPWTWAWLNYAVESFAGDVCHIQTTGTVYWRGSGTDMSVSRSINSYPAMRLLARYCYSALCTRARYRLIALFMLASHRYSALCTLASICNNSHCSCPLHRAECFCSAIESTIACIRLSALDNASLHTTVGLDFLE